MRLAAQALNDDHSLTSHDAAAMCDIHKEAANMRVAKAHPPKRIRQSTKPLMNKLEQEWFEVLKRRHKIIVPQGLRFMLANGTWYKPDFMVWPVGFESQDTRLRAFECKGPHAFRGGKENLKIAAHQYPQIVWTLVWKVDGQWQEQTIFP